MASTLAVLALSCAAVAVVAAVGAARCRAAGDRLAWIAAVASLSAVLAGSASDCVRGREELLRSLGVLVAAFAMVGLLLRRGRFR